MRIGGGTGDRYELLSLLGSGNFGDVWRSRDHLEDDIVAVKLLSPDTDPDRVLKEAGLQRRLSSHPRVVGLRNVELIANPSAFVVSELVPGGSLADVLKVRRPTVRESHRWLRDALEALCHAHALDVLHRDVKPSNLLVGEDAHAQLTDFGVAEDSVLRSAADPGMYKKIAPPEFLAGFSDERSDIWLVGMLGFHLLAGERPDLHTAHREKLPLVHRRSPDVPIALARVIGAALKVDPDDRPQTAERLLDGVVSVPVSAGWHDVVSADPAVVQTWQADVNGNGVTVEVRRAARSGGYRVHGRAQAGSRLASRRDVRAPTLAGALSIARSWLLAVVSGQRL